MKWQIILFYKKKLKYSFWHIIFSFFFILGSRFSDSEISDLEDVSAGGGSGYHRRNRQLPMAGYAASDFGGSIAGKFNDISLYIQMVYYPTVATWCKKWRLNDKKNSSVISVWGFDFFAMTKSWNWRIGIVIIYN